METTLKTQSQSAMIDPTAWGEQTMTQGKKTTNGGRNPLWKSTRDLSALLRVLISLSENAPARMSQGQVAFFVAAALADISGSPATLGDINEFLGEKTSDSVRSSYLQLLQPTATFDKAVGWLEAVVDQADKRRRFLVLTDKGRGVIEDLILAISGSKGD